MKAEPEPLLEYVEEEGRDGEGEKGVFDWDELAKKLKKKIGGR